MILVTILALLTNMVVCIDIEVHEKYLTMDRKAFIEYFNSQNFSWKITDYNRTFHYGCLESPIGDEELPQECIVPLIELPKNFDARERWPQCETIKEIYNQGNCGSCWTFGTGNSASDRTCIHKNVSVHLAEQDFECCQSDVCGGGFAHIAFSFWQKEGLVTNKCKPYNIEKLKKNTCEKKCVDKNISYNADKHYAEKVYRIEKNIDCIKYELNLGPIQASFVVFDDFRDYHKGIYEHKYGGFAGHHSVRVIGYGVENDKDYWLVANSWSKTWGENGYIKIKMQQPDIEFEDRMMAGIPKN